MPNSNSVKRRKAIQRQGRVDDLFDQWRRTLPTAVLTGKPLVRFRERHLQDCWHAAYTAGQLFQYEQIKRVLCQSCQAGYPLIDLSGHPVHEVPKDGGIWRQACDAGRIAAFKP